MRKIKNIMIFTLAGIILISILGIVLTQTPPKAQDPIPVSSGGPAPDLVIPEIPFGTLGLMICLIASLSVYYILSKNKNS